MRKDYEKLLTEVNDKRNAVTQEAEAHRGAYMQAAISYVSGLFEQVARDVAMDQPEITTALGKNGIKRVKEKVTELQQLTPKIVEQHFGRSPYWWSLPAEMRENRSPTPSPSDYMNSDLRKCVGYVGPILEECGYSPPMNLRDGKPSYAGTLGDNEEMKAIRQKYDQCHQQNRDLELQKNNLESEQRRAKMSDLWDSA